MTLRRCRSETGVTLTEVLVASLISLAVAAAVLGLVHPAQGIFQAQPESGEMHQRLRVTVESIARDLRMAGAGLPADTPSVMPYRVGARGSDVDAGAVFRPDAVSGLYVPWEAAAIVSRTYYLESDPGTDTFQLMQYDGAVTDLPLVDHVVGLAFAYIDAGGVQLDPAALQDGPWAPDSEGGGSLDEELRRIRRVRVMVRVRAALASMRGPSGPLFARGGTSTSAERFIPDMQLAFDVTLRNRSVGG